MVPASEPFDPRHFSRVRRPLPEASHLPAWCYTSDEFYRRETERVFRKAWNFLGRADRIAKPGDYFTAEIAGVPLFVLRDRAGRLRAYANSCRHRGARLLSGDGHCTGSITCPYHSWTYDLDGRLKSAPGMQGIKGFDPAGTPLIEVRLETWGGFIFVTFDPAAENLTSYLGTLPELLAPYDFERMICTRRKVYDVACNWKLITENSMEEYHTATVHRASIGAQTIEWERPVGNWEAGYCESDKSIATLPGETEALPWIPTLSGKSKTGTFFVLIYPCTTLACNQDGAFWLELYPRGSARTEVVLGHCFPRSTTERLDFEKIVQKYYGRCDTSIPEDNHIAEQQQLGLDSPLAQPGRVSMYEAVVHSFANWIIDRVLDDRPAIASG
jgi:phenylpropionate dioxygenase-like ring-hydroxylating dioxygenase large terminal subunit